jgi:Ankyrin repeats (3 copies)
MMINKRTYGPPTSPVCLQKKRISVTLLSGTSLRQTRYCSIMIHLVRSLHPLYNLKFVCAMLQRVMTAYNSDQSSSTDDSTGRQLLTAVSSNMPVANVEELLSRIAQPDLIVDSDGNTALMLAAKNANLALVDLLVSRGASINQTDSSRHRTALMCAVKTGNKDIVERLLMSPSGSKCNETMAL